MQGLVKRDDFGIGVADVVKFFTVIVVATIMADVVAGRTSPLATQYIESQMYQGVTDPRECAVTHELSLLDLINETPFTPWVSAQFINDGPGSVWVGVNNPDSLFEVKAGENATINRLGALERILSVYHVCEAGSTATLRIIGEY